MDEQNHLYDIAALLPGVGVFGGVRRFIEIGNELTRRGHSFTIYHPDGHKPEWLPFLGETKPLNELGAATHQVLVCNDPPLLNAFETARAELKLFYFVLEGIRHERMIARRREWIPVTNSTGMWTRLWMLYRVRAERVIGGVDLETFSSNGPTASHDGDALRILAYGRASRRRKGVALAVRAVESLSSRSERPVQLVLFDHIGPGNETDTRERIQSPLSIEFHINLSQPGLAQLYRGCDIFLSAEKRAGWANTVAEAMASGLPVVCTKSGTRDLAIHRETAWVSTFRHPFFLRRGLEVLRRDPALMERLGSAALERVRQFSWPHVTDQFLEVIGRRLQSLRRYP